MNFITNKNARKIYNSSFVLLVLCIILLLILKENICYYVYLFRILYALERVCYSAPYELVVIGSNSNRKMSSFLANINILSALATIITPIFSGFMIEKFSYEVLFLILVIEAFIIIVISTQIKNFYITNRKINLKKFLVKTKKYNHLKDIYKCMFYRRISSQGAIVDLLPIILFLKLGSELTLGAYNSLFAILSISFLSCVKIINKKNISKKFYIPFSIIIFISSIVLVYYPSLLTLLIYYIFMNTLGTVIESESCSIVYESINVDDMSEYKREHIIVFNIYMLIGQIISYVVSYLLYIYFYNVNILSIVVTILMFFLIISSFYLQKTEKYLTRLRS